VAVVAAALLFVAAALAVGRWLQADNAERGQVERLLEAQARGDAAAMARELDGCGPECLARVERLAARFGGDGGADVEIVRYDSQTAHALGAETGRTRVVWRVPPGLPIVQCVRVARTGSALTGPRVRLLELGAPIDREAGC
jgi:hypothetical protein